MLAVAHICTERFESWLHKVQPYVKLEWNLAHPLKQGLIIITDYSHKHESCRSSFCLYSEIHPCVESAFCQDVCLFSLHLAGSDSFLPLLVPYESFSLLVSSQQRNSATAQRNIPSLGNTGINSAGCSVELLTGLFQVTRVMMRRNNQDSFVLPSPVRRTEPQAFFVTSTSDVPHIHLQPF